MTRSDQDDRDLDGFEPDAAFDAELSAMFQDAAPREADPAFTAQVLARVDGANRNRFIALGGAGATGAAIAGTQIERLLDFTVTAGDGLLAQALSYVGPEAIVTAGFAAVAVAFSRLLPGVRFA
ncbi:MAG: hypothetical protein ABL308_11080 [Oceanicaulis sp.]